MTINGSGICIVSEITPAEVSSPVEAGPKTLAEDRQRRKPISNEKVNFAKE